MNSSDCSEHATAIGDAEKVTRSARGNCRGKLKVVPPPAVVFVCSFSSRNSGRRKSFFPLLFFRRNEELRKSFVVGKASGKRSWAEILGMEDCAHCLIFQVQGPSTGAIWPN